MYATVLGFITAFTLTFLSIPSIIKVAALRGLFDRPNERSAHKTPTPSLGGIGIFAGANCAIILWTPFDSFGDLQNVLAASVILFLIGVKDDLLPMTPAHKFLGQILCSIILVYKANIRITSWYGIAGVYVLPDMLSFIFSIVLIVGIINAFNLIDGINGLAGSVGLLACVFLGSWFFLIDRFELAILAFSFAGSVLAFLKYNFTPAKIFMGDTGSLLLGMVCAVLAIEFVELHREMPVQNRWTFQSAPAIAVAILILPLYDTARVFVKRMVKGKSPFSPDKTHIHHQLLEIGLTHMQATYLLLGINLFLIVLSVILNHLDNNLLLGIVLLIALVLSTLLSWYVERQRAILSKKNEPSM